MNHHHRNLAFLVEHAEQARAATHRNELVEGDAARSHSSMTGQTVNLPCELWPVSDDAAPADDRHCAGLDYAVHPTTESELVLLGLHVVASGLVPATDGQRAAARQVIVDMRIRQVWRDGSHERIGFWYHSPAVRDLHDPDDIVMTVAAQISHRWEAKGSIDGYFRTLVDNRLLDQASAELGEAKVWRSIKEATIYTLFSLVGNADPANGIGFVDGMFAWGDLLTSFNPNSDVQTARNLREADCLRGAEDKEADAALVGGLIESLLALTVADLGGLGIDDPTDTLGPWTIRKLLTTARFDGHAALHVDAPTAAATANALIDALRRGATAAGRESRTAVVRMLEALRTKRTGVVSIDDDHRGGDLTASPEPDATDRRHLIEMGLRNVDALNKAERRVLIDLVIDDAAEEGLVALRIWALLALKTDVDSWATTVARRSANGWQNGLRFWPATWSDTAMASLLADAYARQSLVDLAVAHRWELGPG